MYVTIITDDHDNFSNKGTNNEKNIDIIISTLLLTIPCGLSF